ncbi:replication initiator protein A [Myxococcota bacterium]|nr:replication initiator protein A [Myxococcota bacterium]MBU1413905.1 replication initiator protein A [Myxococcota bacterium]
MKSDQQSNKPQRKTAVTPLGENASVTRAIKTAQERCINLLSPELQNKIRELEQIPLLPDWPDKTRGVPNLCLRSALFGVIRRGRRRAVKGEVIASVQGLNIRYTGWRLDQGDFDVLVQTLHLQTRHIEKTSKNYIRFEVKSFLRAIGRQPGKSGREWLKDCFRRLTATAVEINVELRNRYGNEAYTYAGSLVDEFYYNDREHTYFLKINPKLAELFDAGWTQLQWQQRLQLKTDLAKWLHGFYSSHRVPYPMKVATLKHLCGSDCKRLVDYRRSIRNAMAELVNAGAIQAWQIDRKDKIHVQRFANRPISK